MKPCSILITCEHAFNQVPRGYEKYFQQAGAVLQSHRGWDPGALRYATKMAEYFDVYCHHYDYTRLLIEPNRSLWSPQLFSEFTLALNQNQKQVLIECFYQPYRQQVIDLVSASIEQGKSVRHLSIHSFTPIWNGEERQVDIGLLCDENRHKELDFCNKWSKAFADRGSPVKVKINEPYNGADDGFTTTLRQQFPADKYIGIEVEISQQYALDEYYEKMAFLLNTTLSEIISEE